MPNQKKIEELGELLQSLSDICKDKSENNVCGNLSDDTIDDIGQFLIKLLDVKVGYKTAQKMTKLGINALYTRASRDNVKTEKCTLFPLSWVMKLVKK